MRPVPIPASLADQNVSTYKNKKRAQYGDHMMMGSFTAILTFSQYTAGKDLLKGKLGWQ